MMPMRMIHPWNMVILLYVIGLVISFASLCYARKSLKVKMIFFLSILGVGLFLYYQGRSHDLCLLPVSFPAIILMTIYADSMFCRIKLRNRFNDELVFAIMLSFMLFAGGSLLKNSPFIYKVIKERLSAVMNKEVNFVTQAAEFVKDNTGEGEEVLILSNLSGVYYLESGAVCPLQISGTTEIFLVEEYQKIYEFLGSEEVNKLIVDKRCHLYGPIKDRLSKYKIINTSPDGCHVVYLKE